MAPRSRSVGRTRRFASAAALAALLLTLPAALPAVADHNELAQSKGYIVVADAVRVGGLVTGFDCEGRLAGVGVNCVTFLLTGREHQVDVHVADVGQAVLWKADRTVERIAGPHGERAADSVKETYDGTDAPASGQVNDTVDEATADRTRFFFVSGRTYFEDAGGDVLIGARTFCGSQTRMNVHSKAVALTVLLDGAAMGNALLSECGTTYSGGTAGSVHMAVPLSN